MCKVWQWQKRLLLLFLFSLKIPTQNIRHIKKGNGHRTCRPKYCEAKATRTFTAHLGQEAYQKFT
jgi:hypothetical protein